MPRIPDSPEQVFESYASDLQKIFGENLVAISLFGSGAHGEYVRGKSDINFLVVLTQKGIDDLSVALDFVDKWRKINVAAPLFLTEAYIKSALDTFPIEFLDIKNFHKHVFGKNVIAEITIDKQDLRRQVERELRGKLIHLRGGFLNAGKDRKFLEEMLAASISAFGPIFKALLYLKDEPVPNSREQVFAQTAKSLNLDGGVFTNLASIKHGRWQGSKVQLQEFTLSYIREVKKLVELVDRM